MFRDPGRGGLHRETLHGQGRLFQGVDAFLDWHPDFQTTAYYRTCNAYASVCYTFRGASAHGNKPWLGRSALEGAEVMGVAVNFLRAI